ncbi:hypothetical protein BJ875DRAFT_446717 [Amylocarpus encephaloides]|uniref:Uncharacterized protein n=1 Tax=Amylocarpus encephaloides TaxID=45428 RepID=A0A9P7Y7P3_9HELO|nr:hypothetical protein BJ875DRAFT_446717 [Amylocarpus encephaloides]
MPSESQTLLDIQTILPILIGISISRQKEEGVTSLKTRNAWENIKIEIEQFRLYMKLGENLVRNNALHPMLLAIDSMVDDRVLRSGQSSSSPDPSSLKVLVRELEPTINYPKIKALMREASNHVISDNSFTYLSSMIHLPTSDFDSREVEKMVTDFNVINSVAQIEEPSTTLISTQVGVDKATFIADSRAGPEVQKLEILQTSTRRLFNTLVEKAINKPTRYKFYNTIRINLRDPIESENTLQYRLFFSSCLVGET